MTEKIYTVSGMSCGRCATGVAERVVEVSGVTEVDIDVLAGRVTVRGETVDGEAVRTAIDQAGYLAHDASARTPPGPGSPARAPGPPAVGPVAAAV